MKFSTFCLNMVLDRMAIFLETHYSQFCFKPSPRVPWQWKMNPMTMKVIYNDLGIYTLSDGHDEVLKGAYQHAASTITGTQTLMYLAAPQQSRPGKPMHCTSTRRSVLYVLLQTEHLPKSMHCFMATNWFKVDYHLLLRYFSFQMFEHQKHLPSPKQFC